MTGAELIGRANVPDGVELQLLRSNDAFAIVLDRNELMDATDLEAKSNPAVIPHDAAISARGTSKAPASLQSRRARSIHAEIS